MVGCCEGYSGKTSDMCVGEFGLSPLSGVYLRKIVYRYLLVSLKIHAILGEATFHQTGMRPEQMTEGNELGNAHTTTTLTRLKW